MNAKEWFVGQILKDGATFVEPQFLNETPTIPLLPFRQSAEPQLRFWDSNGSRNWEIFGHRYPNIPWNSPTNPSANIERQVAEKFTHSYLWLSSIGEQAKLGPPPEMLPKDFAKTNPDVFTALPPPVDGPLPPKDQQLAATLASAPPVDNFAGLAAEEHVDIKQMPMSNAKPSHRQAQNSQGNGSAPQVAQYDEPKAGYHSLRQWNVDSRVQRYVPRHSIWPAH